MKIIDRLYKIFPATFPRFHITIERWKFNSKFKVWVSNYGDVRDEKKIPCEYKIDNQGYIVYKFGKIYTSAHRLVMLTWSPREDSYSLTVDHINSNKRDNRFCNLEWVSEKENQRRAAQKSLKFSVIKMEKEAKKAEQKKKYNGYSKEEYQKRQMDIWAARFMQGTLWVNHTGYIVNKDNIKEFVTKKSGWQTGFTEEQMARKFINAAFRSGHYCGWHWKMCGDTEVEIKKENK